MKSEIEKLVETYDREFDAFALLGKARLERIENERRIGILERSLEKRNSEFNNLKEVYLKVLARRNKWKAKALELEAAQCEKVEQKERFLDELFDCVSHLKKYRNGQYVFLNGESWIHCKAQKVAQALVNLSLL